MKSTKNQILTLLISIIFFSCNNENKRHQKENKNINALKENTTTKKIPLTDKKVLNFMHINGMPTSEPTLTGEYMSKLDLKKLKVFTIKIANKNGIEDDEKSQTIEILGYETLKGYHGNKPNYNKKSSNDPDIIADENSFNFIDSSEYCVGEVTFYNNIYDKKPECTYQILSTRRFIYENEKGKLRFQMVYPDRLLKLCK
jgi:PBP1b-binding outer membrane lipoprotein LpoB